MSTNISATSGSRASGSVDHVRKIILKDKETYGPWKTKITSILDADDFWTIVDRTELSPAVVASIAGPNNTVTNQAEVNESRALFKGYAKRTNKATSLITQIADDSIVMMLDIHNRDPRAIWDQLAKDCDNVTPSGKFTAEKEFHDFRIPEDANFLEIKQSFNELLRKVRVQGGDMTAPTHLQTLLGALPPKYDSLKEAFFARDIVCVNKSDCC